MDGNVMFFLIGKRIRDTGEVGIDLLALKEKNIGETLSQSHRVTFLGQSSLGRSDIFNLF